MTFLAQIETAVKASAELVDRAAVASDRWLFLAALVALLVTMATVIYWLVQSLEKKAIIHAEERIEWKKERVAEQAACKAERKEDQAEYLASMKTVNADIQGLAAEIKKNTEVLTRHDTEMRAAHAVETRTIVEAELKRMHLHGSI